MSTHHTTDRPEPEQRFATPDQLFHLIERNRGRLHVLEYAALGLEHVGGGKPGCMTWVLHDVLEDLQRIGDSLPDNLK